MRARLEARRPEIEQEILARVHAVSDSAGAEDPEYVQGLRAAASAALGYGLAGIARGERSGPIPAVLFAQTRRAARNGIGLDTVLRRYFAGYTLLGDFVVQEAEDGGLLRGAALRRVLRAQAALFDRLVLAITDEYTRATETEGRVGSLEQRRAEHVERLLAGELVDPAELAYELDAWHIAAIAAGRRAKGTMEDLATALDRRLLVVHCDEGTVWAWLGGVRRFDSAELARLASAGPVDGVSLAVGEPGEGAAGWRLTHRQAAAAWPLALRGPRSPVRYADVALLASILQDDILASSLNQLYLSPLAEERDGGAALRRTLRAYFAAGRSASSSAAALGVDRHTVASRLRTVEERLGRPLGDCALELEAALRLEGARDLAAHRDG